MPKGENHASGGQDIAGERAERLALDDDECLDGTRGALREVGRRRGSGRSACCVEMVSHKIALMIELHVDPIRGETISWH